MLRPTTENKEKELLKPLSFNLSGGKSREEIAKGIGAVLTGELNKHLTPPLGMPKRFELLENPSTFSLIFEPDDMADGRRYFSELQKYIKRAGLTITDLTRLDMMTKTVIPTGCEIQLKLEDFNFLPQEINQKLETQGCIVYEKISPIDLTEDNLSHSETSDPSKAAAKPLSPSFGTEPLSGTAPQPDSSSSSAAVSPNKDSSPKAPASPVFSFDVFTETRPEDNPAAAAEKPRAQFFYDKNSSTDANGASLAVSGLGIYHPNSTEEKMRETVKNIAEKTLTKLLDKCKEKEDGISPLFSADDVLGILNASIRTGSLPRGQNRVFAIITPLDAIEIFDESPIGKTKIQALKQIDEFLYCCGRPSRHATHDEAEIRSTISTIVKDDANLQGIQIDDNAVDFSKMRDVPLEDKVKRLHQELKASAVKVSAPGTAGIFPVPPKTAEPLKKTAEPSPLPAFDAGPVGSPPVSGNGQPGATKAPLTK